MALIVSLKIYETLYLYFYAHDADLARWRACSPSSRTRRTSKGLRWLCLLCYDRRMRCLIWGCEVGRYPLRHKHMPHYSICTILKYPFGNHRCGALCSVRVVRPPCGGRRYWCFGFLLFTYCINGFYASGFSFLLRVLV